MSFPCLRERVNYKSKSHPTLSLSGGRAKRRGIKKGKLPFISQFSIFISLCGLESAPAVSRFLISVFRFDFVESAPARHNQSHLVSALAYSQISVSLQRPLCHEIKIVLQGFGNRGLTYLVQQTAGHQLEISHSPLGINNTTL